MKNKIAAHIILCGLLTAANMIVAMDGQLIKSEESPPPSPRNNTAYPVFPTNITPTSEGTNPKTSTSPKISPPNLTSNQILPDKEKIPQISPVHSPRKKETENSTSALNLNRSRSKSPILFTKQNHQIAPLCFSNQKPNTPHKIPYYQGTRILPHPDKEAFLIEYVDKDDCNLIKYIETCAHINDFCTKYFIVTDKTICAQFVIELPRPDSNKETRIEEKIPNLTEQKPQESLQGWFTNMKPQSQVPCYLGSVESEFFTPNQGDHFNYNVTYQNENGQESVIQINSSQQFVQRTDTFIMITSPNTHTFAIELSQPDSSNKKPFIQEKTKKTGNLTKKTARMQLTPNNGITPTNIVIGVFTLAAFCVVAVAYKYNKLDVFITLLNKLLPNRYAL